MRHELHRRVDAARELGRTGAVSDHIARSLAVFLDIHDAKDTYAVGVRSGNRAVAGFAAVASLVLVVDGDDVWLVRPQARVPRELIGWTDSALVEFTPDSCPVQRSVGHAISRATIVAAAEAAGVAAAALSAAVAYATSREQFKAPIATYQALAHRLVDMRIAADAADLAVEQAVIEPMALHAARAKVCADHAAQVATAGLHQVHGGVGFLAGMPPPPLFARSLALSQTMGDARHHRALVARHHGLLT